MAAGGRNPAADERLLPEEKLLQRRDYQRCYQHGRRRYSSLATLHFVSNELQRARLGITVTRKVGNSVVRHRLKRRVREIYRRWAGRRELPSVDMVIHLKPSAGSSDFPSLSAQVLRLFQEIGKGGGRRQRRRRDR